jgi:hypothetical protein
MNSITPVIFYSEPDAVAMSFNTFNQLMDTDYLLKSPAMMTQAANLMLMETLNYLWRGAVLGFSGPVFMNYCGASH